MNNMQEGKVNFLEKQLRSVFGKKSILWYDRESDAWILAGVKILSVTGESVDGVDSIRIVLDGPVYADAILNGGEVEILLDGKVDGQDYLWVRRVAPLEEYALEDWRINRLVEALQSSRAEMRVIIRRSYRRYVDGAEEYMDLLLMANSLGDMEVIRSHIDGDRTYIQTRDERVSVECLHCRSATAEIAGWDLQFEETQ